MKERPYERLLEDDPRSAASLPYHLATLDEREIGATVYVGDQLKRIADNMEEMQKL